MKKMKFIVIFIFMLCIGVFALVACGGQERLFTQRLDTPVNLLVDDYTNILTWDDVENSTGGFRLDINGDIIDIPRIDVGILVDYYGNPVFDENNRPLRDMRHPAWYSLANLPAGTYAIRVQALTIDNNYFRNSDWSNTITHTILEVSGLSYRLINNNSEYEIAGIGSAFGDVVINETRNGRPITHIAANAFAGSGRITGITMGSNIISIGDRAFFNNSRLTSVDFSKNLIVIGERAFQGAVRLTSIDLPDSLITIGNYAFQNTGLISVHLPDSLINLGELAFSNSGSLTTVTMGSGLTSISEGAFFNTARLSSVVFGINVVEIAESAFRNSGLVSMAAWGNVRYIGNNAFRNSTLTLVVLGGNIQSIGTGAFRDARSLETVQMGANLLRIGGQAFYNCMSLINIFIGENVNSIGAEAFNGTPQWHEADEVVSISNWAVDYKIQRDEDNRIIFADEIIIPFGTVGIADDVFRSISFAVVDAEPVRLFDGVDDIVLPDGLKHIGRNAFRSHRQLSDITIPNSLVTIAEYAFFGNSSLASINFVPQSNLEIIGASSFRESGLVNLVIPNSVTYIGWGAFAFSRQMTNLTIGVGVERIGSFAFQDCDLLINVILPDNNSLSSIGTESFLRTRLWNDASPGIVYVGNWVVGAKMLIDDTNPDNPVQLPLPATIRAGTRGIAAFAFYRIHLPAAGAAPFVIPQGVRYIGESAFRNTSGPMAISIPDTVSRLENNTFRMSGIQAAFIPNSITYIGEGVFQNARNLHTFNFQPGINITCISDYMFTGASQLTSINIPESITRIGFAAFHSSGLTSVYIPQNVVKIDDHAFRTNPFLREIEISEAGEGLTIGMAAFMSTGLYGVVLGGRVRKIGEYAFRYSALRSVVVEGNIESIGNHAFRDIHFLESVVIGGNVREIGRHSFRGNENLESVVIGDNVRVIGEYAFYGAESLTSVVLGEAVEIIGAYAFNNCVSLASILLPDSLKIIGKYAFFGSGLDSIIIPATVNAIGSHAFFGIENLTIYRETAHSLRYWGLHWNSSNHPVFWGVELSDNRDFVVSFIRTTVSISNFEGRTLSPPYRSGYVFGGWAAVINGMNIAFNMANLVNAPGGTVLTAIWSGL